MDDKAQYLLSDGATQSDTSASTTYADRVAPERKVKTFTLLPGEDERSRLFAIQRAQNPLLEASRVLLRALCDIPQYMNVTNATHIQQYLVDEVKVFAQLCEQANIRREHTIGARYCLCTALDEAAMLKLGAQGVSAWANASLATTFHEDNKGGEKVYFLIGRLMTDPKDHIDLLEVIYRALSLGFEGMYRSNSKGGREHEAVRLRIYTEIAAQRPSVPIALSPHWQSDVIGRSRLFYNFPVWITVIVLSSLLLGYYGYAKYDLATRAARVQRQILDIARLTPSPAAPVLHLRELLSNEIAAGWVGVDEDTQHSKVTFRGDDMFVTGNAAINAPRQPLVEKIAAEIARVGGVVTVTGHTDNTPIKSRLFVSNQALSEERAMQVVQVLQRAGVTASRLQAVGKGDTEPLADNNTAHGRAQNRRIEINVAE